MRQSARERERQRHVEAGSACCTRMKRADPLAQFRLTRLTAEEIIFLNCHLSLCVASFIRPNRQPASLPWWIALPSSPFRSTVGGPFRSYSPSLRFRYPPQIPSNPTSLLNLLMVTRSGSPARAKSSLTFGHVATDNRIIYRDITS